MFFCTQRPLIDVTNTLKVFRTEYVCGMVTCVPLTEGIVRAFVGWLH